MKLACSISLLFASALSACGPSAEPPKTQVDAPKNETSGGAGTASTTASATAASAPAECARLTKAAADLEKIKKSDPPGAIADSFDRFADALKAPFTDPGLEARAAEMRPLAADVATNFRALDATLTEATGWVKKMKSVDVDTPNAGFQKACAGSSAADCGGVKAIVTEMYAGDDPTKLHDGMKTAVDKLSKLKAIKTAGLQKAVDGYVKAFGDLSQMLEQVASTQAKAEDGQRKVSAAADKLGAAAKKLDDLCPGS